MATKYSPASMTVEPRIYGANSLMSSVIDLVTAIVPTVPAIAPPTCKPVSKLLELIKRGRAI